MLAFIPPWVLSARYQKRQKWWRFNSQFQFYSFYLFFFLASISITLMFSSNSNSSFSFTSPFPQWEPVAAPFSSIFQQSQRTVTKPIIDLPGVTFKYKSHLRLRSPLPDLMWGNYGVNKKCGRWLFTLKGTTCQSNTKKYPDPIVVVILRVQLFQLLFKSYFKP